MENFRKNARSAADLHGYVTFGHHWLDGTE
jgi:hypothetical protein